jgi:hypothetical protein
MDMGKDTMTKSTKSDWMDVAFKIILAVMAVAAIVVAYCTINIEFIIYTGHDIWGS